MEVKEKEAAYEIHHEIYYKMMERTYLQLTWEQWEILCGRLPQVITNKFITEAPEQVRLRYENAKEMGFSRVQIVKIYLAGLARFEFAMLAYKKESGSLPFLVARWGSQPLSKWGDFVEDWMWKEKNDSFQIPNFMSRAFALSIAITLFVWIISSPLHILWKVARTLMFTLFGAAILYYARMAYHRWKIPSPFKV